MNVNHISDKRMLDLIEKLKHNNIIKFKQDFYDVIGVPKQNIRRIKLGLQHFTPVQIGKACREYDINANWIFGIEKQIFRDSIQTKTQTK